MARRVTKPAHKPVRGLLRTLCLLHWQYSRARDHLAYPVDELGPVTFDGDDLVLWDKPGRKVLNRYKPKPAALKRSTHRTVGGHPERLAFTLLEEL